MSANSTMLTEQVLQWHGMKECKPHSTPLQPGVQLTAEPPLLDEGMARKFRGYWER